MIIANRLNDGLVVFFRAEGQWATAIGDGLVIDDAARSGALLDDARHDELRCIVIDPQLIEVEIGVDGPRPTAIREAIRAFGPTV